ncbi:spore coat protein U domain-containing protein [Azospirillum soli]|uniref:spore coat protein U domain-containing protein n=1 Tax=Azospirillum soli TaxID=1304799 RepID=UPI001AE70B93|nr:spore coat protein U domain-containing protein [Azospirillum soli]MBP2311040.1 spore coat protein U-like protein [Azospirillum soli]
MSKIAAIARTALIAAALAGAAVAPAIAATTGTVKLSGTVALNCSVAVTDLNQALNLVGGESARQVGTVVENCNSGTGYSISISSANGGLLKNENSGSVSYRVGYDGQNNNLTGGLSVTRSTAQFAKSVPLTVSLDANGNAIAGNYSDTVTITIAAK